MKCPTCTYIEDMALCTKNISFVYKGEVITILATGLYCSQCEEMILANDEWKRVDAILKKFYQDIKIRNSEPPVFAMKLMGVLDRHPELLPEVR